MYSRYQLFLLENPDIRLICLVSGMRGQMDSKIESILKILSQLKLPPTLLEAAKQALNRIHDIQVLDRLTYKALRLLNEQDVYQWLDEYLSQNERENKIESILETLRIRMQFSTRLLEPIAQALIRIDDIQVLEYLEFEALRSSNTEGVHKFRVLLRQESSSGTESDKQLVTNSASWTYFAFEALDKYFPKSDEENIYQWLDKYSSYSKSFEDETKEKIKSKILKILHRLHFSPTFLEFAMQALNYIPYIEALRRLEDVILDSKDEQDVRKYLNECLSGYPHFALEVQRVQDGFQISSKYLPQSMMEDKIETPTE